MNEKYLIELHKNLGITDDINTWISAVKNNNSYLNKVHVKLGITDDFKTWKSKVFGTTAVKTKKPVVTKEKEVVSDEDYLTNLSASDRNFYKSMGMDDKAILELREFQAPTPQIENLSDINTSINTFSNVNRGISTTNDNFPKNTAISRREKHEEFMKLVDSGEFDLVSPTYGGLTKKTRKVEGQSQSAPFGPIDIEQEYYVDADGNEITKQMMDLDNVSTIQGSRKVNGEWRSDLSNREVGEYEDAKRENFAQIRDDIANPENAQARQWEENNKGGGGGIGGKVDTKDPYNGGEQNPYRVGAMDEDEFGAWLKQLMGEGVGYEEIWMDERGAVKLPGEQIFVVDLQAWTDDGRTKAVGQINKIKKFARDRAANPNKYLVYHDFKTFRNLLSQASAKEVRNFNELRKRYAKVGLDIQKVKRHTKYSGTRAVPNKYIVKKDGKIIWEGRGERSSHLDEKPSLGDFMFNYKFTKDEYAEINIGRQVSALQLEETQPIIDKITKTTYGNIGHTISNSLDFGAPRPISKFDEKHGPGEGEVRKNQFSWGFGNYMDDRFNLSNKEWKDTYGFERTNHTYSAGSKFQKQNNEAILKDFLLYLESVSEPRKEGEDIDTYILKMQNRMKNESPFGREEITSEMEAMFWKTDEFGNATGVNNKEEYSKWISTTWHQPSSNILNQLEAYLSNEEYYPFNNTSISGAVAKIKANNIKTILGENAKYQNLIGANNTFNKVSLEKEIVYTQEAAADLVIKETDNYVEFDKILKTHVGNAKSAGVTEVEYNETTGLFTVKATSDAVAKQYQGIFNNAFHEQEVLQKAFAKEYIDLNNVMSSFQSRADAIESTGGAVSINYDYSEQLLAGTQMSFKKLGLALPALFGNDAAKDAHNEVDKHYRTQFLNKGRYDEQGSFKGFLKYAGLTVAENSAVTTVALLTYGYGSVLGLSAGTLSTMVGVEAAISAGGETRVQLENLADDVVEWKDMKRDLMSMKSEIPIDKYNSAMLELDNMIIANDYSWEQKWGKITTAMVIEGVVTKYIGATNYKMTANAFMNPMKDIVKNLTRGNFKAGMNVLGETSKGIAREGLEEELIYVGNAIMDWSILEKDFDMSDWDVVLVDAAIISGPMVGSGAFYQTVMTQMATSDIRAVYEELKKEDTRIDNEIIKLNQVLDMDPSSRALQLSLLKAQKLDNFAGFGIIQNEMEGTAMSLGSENLNNIIASSKVLQDLALKANIDPSISLDLQAAMIKEYAASLDPKAAKEFKGQWDAAIKLKDVAFSGKQSWEQTTERVYGEQGKIILEGLIKNNPKLKNASKKDQFIAIHAEYKKQLSEEQIGKGKSNKSAVEFVEETIYGKGGFSNAKTKKGKKRKNRNIQLENQYYQAVGRQIQMDQSDGVMVLGKDQDLAASVISDERLKSLEIIPTKGGKKGLKEALEKAYTEEQQTEIDNINLSKVSKAKKADGIQKIKAKYKANKIQMIDALTSGKVNAIIVGGKYIVQDGKTAKTAVEAGNWLAGTAIFHEVGHGIDALAFDAAGKTNYAKKLQDYVKENHLDIHNEALDHQIKIGNYKIDTKTGEVKFPKGEDIFWDEYSMEVQTRFRRDKLKGGKESAKLAKLSSGIANAYRSMTDGNFKINSPKDAAVYLSSFIEGWSKGEVGKLQKRRIDNPGEEKRGTTGTKQSKDTPLEAINKLIPKDVKTKKEYDAIISDPRKNKDIFNAITKEGGVINNYIRSRQVSKEEGDKTIENTVDRVLAFNPEALREDGTKVGVKGFGESIFANTRFGKLDAKKALAIEAARLKTETPTDIGATTKEGEIKMQVKDTDTSTQDKLETEDISIAAQIKEKQTGEKDPVELSKFRRKLGIETGGKLYNTVLDAVRKTFGTILPTMSEGKLKNALVKSFKVELKTPIANFLGVKNKYFENLKKHRVAIVNAISTAELVQMERLVPAKDRIFTVFDRRLTKIDDVKAAIDKQLLPPEALNKITKDKLTGKGAFHVDLYKKVMPTETEFIGFFDQPLNVPSKKDPKFTVRSGLRGTRKDVLAEQMASSLALDGTMQVIHEPAIQSKREQLADLRGDKLTADDKARLADIINRPIDTKFSTNPELKAKIAAWSVIELNKISEKNGTAYGIIQQDVLETLNKGFRADLKPQEIVANIDGVISRYLTNPEDKGLMSHVVKSGKINIEYINEVLDNIKKITVREIKQVAVPALINNLDTKLKKAIPNNRPQIIIEFLENSGKSIRTVMPEVDGKIITTNESVHDNILFKLLDKYKIEGFSVKPLTTKAGKRRMYKSKFGGKKQYTKIQYKKGEEDAVEINTYKKITDIKRNFKGSIPEINKQAETAQKYVLEIINDKTLTTAEKIVILKLLTTDQLGAFRKLSKAGEYILNKKGQNYKTGETTLDHNPTIKYLFNETINAIGNESKITKLKETTWNNALVNLISKKGNNILTKNGLRSDGDLVRYNNTGFINERKNHQVHNTKESRGIDPISKATLFSRSVNNPTQGITVLDFDDTLATTKSKVKFTRPDGTTGALNAEQYASTYESLAEQGYKFDFTEFNKVVKGKKAPLFEKALKLQDKFGSNNMFILTARPVEATVAIHTFLKANGLNIPMKNITGLGNSTAKAKADWVAGKVSEGFNDFYFADDALQNVKAVKTMLNQFDVKSKVQQARTKFSKGISLDFNKMLKRTTGVATQSKFSDVQAKLRGRKNKYFSIVPASAQDFAGLLYNFLGKGKQGDKDMAFFKKALIDPFARGIDELNTSKQSAEVKYKEIIKNLPDTKKILNEKVDDNFTVDQAIRVYLWNKAGYDIPGLSKRDLNMLDEFVKGDPELMEFAYEVSQISNKEGGYSKPGNFWVAENIGSDLFSDGALGEARATFLTQWEENTDQIFSKDNLNKIEAIYGYKFREALDDILYRMKTGRNRPTGASRLQNEYMNWVNGSVGAIMFFNIRSAVLQTISATNYLNWTDNNPANAALAFANQKQFWSDFAMLFNSDYLKQRRSKNQRSVSESELSEAVTGVGAFEQTKAAIRYLLKIGFKPTQIADSFAIASGGASFFRNRTNKYVKEGMTQAEAEAKAFLDFQETTEVSQQSARPDMISQQQASPLGRLILSFQNTPMQYARIMNKAARDLVNGRGDTKTHVSKIAYYGVIQSIVFASLQSALFAVIGMDDDEELIKDKNGVMPGKDGYIKTVKDVKGEFLDKKKDRILNTMVDSWLSGIGYGGKAVATVKNTVLEYLEQKDKGFTGDHAYTILAMLGFSPPIGSKIQKVYSSIQTEKFNEGVFKKRGFSLDNPIWMGIGSTVEALTNIPVGRLAKKMLNLDNAMDSSNEWWQRVALVLGWSTWDLGIKDKDIEQAKLELKQDKEVVATQKKEDEKWDKLKKKYPKKSDEQIKVILKTKELFNLSKEEQVNLLKSLDIDPSKFKTEKERAKKIAELYKKNSEVIDGVVTLSNSKTKEQKAEELKEYRKKNTKKKEKVSTDPRKKYKRKGDPRKR